MRWLIEAGLSWEDWGDLILLYMSHFPVVCLEMFSWRTEVQECLIILSCVLPMNVSLDKASHMTSLESRDGYHFTQEQAHNKTTGHRVWIQEEVKYCSQMMLSTKTSVKASPAWGMSGSWFKGLSSVPQAHDRKDRTLILNPICSLASVSFPHSLTTYLEWRF